ncbi:hypothetical protein L596_000144 [Steinernema carpocapsae]|uniref:TILa domain-containing protein n=1 Tax=Steinernema carpocapsae TaxID=34508 RepID=A0A4U8UH01_STECR|nr:hypothetical protein L596_000144 [Steinernema carpocapsae]
MMMNVVIFVAFVAGVVSCDCDCKIYDKDSGINYLTSELLDLIKVLKERVAKCDGPMNPCDVQPPMKSWLTENCTKKNVCVNNQMYTQPMDCPASSACERVNGDMTCVCSAGYKWNWNTSVCIKA